jgi:hypothetical protein
MNNPKLTQVIKELAKNILKEDYQDKYKIIGILTTDLTNHSQTDIYSDIRSITGITVISSKEPMAYSEQNLSQFKSILTVKIDGYPFMKRGGFSRENIQAIINEIKKVDGVVSFIVNPSQITPIR